MIEGILIGFKNVLAINQNTEQSNSPPRHKVTINMGVGEVITDKKVLEKRLLLRGRESLDQIKLNT